MGRNSTRECFAQLFLIGARNEDFSLKEVVKYPLTESPLSIAQPDGTLARNKSKIATPSQEKFHESPKLDDKSVPSIEPTLIDVGLLTLSCMAIIGRFKCMGDLARNMLAAAMAHKGRSIHVLFDRNCECFLRDRRR